MTGVTTDNRNMKFGQLKDVKNTPADSMFVKENGVVKGVEPVAYLEKQLDPIYLDHEEGATKIFAIAMAVVL